MEVHETNNRTNRKLSQKQLIACAIIGSVVIIFIFAIFLWQSVHNNASANTTNETSVPENGATDEIGETLLPLGTVVYLQEGNVKLVIVGRGVTFDNEGKEAFSDYIGVIYPKGFDPNNALFFNHGDIERVVFKGYADEEEEQFLQIYDKWHATLPQAQRALKIEHLNVAI
jgi:hypothetical protein